jgi:hypothetical protein
VTRGAAFFAAVLVTIGRPTWWLLALATFLVRGGIVLAILPIVTLPSPLALSNAFAPILLPLALGRLEPAIVAGPALVVGTLLVWLVGGGRIAAGIEIALVGEQEAAAIDEGVARRPETGPPRAPDEHDRAHDGTPRPASSPGVAWRALAVRLAAWVPLAVALGIGVAQIVEVTYLELTRPSDASVPLVLRVAGGVVSHLGLIAVAWVVGEVVGGVATRRVSLAGRGGGSSLLWAIRTTAAHPMSWLVPWLATTAILVVVMGGTLGAAAFAWTRAVDALSDRVTDPFLALGTLLAFVAVWLAAMFLGGVILAVRSASQTFEHARRDALAGARATGREGRDPAAGSGTFGSPSRSRPGDWSTDDDGGSL